MATDVLLAVGTRKGLFLARSGDDRATWTVSGPHLPMEEVSAIGIDKRDGALPPPRRVDELALGPDRRALRRPR